jgi:hypothetical protein
MKDISTNARLLAITTFLFIAFVGTCHSQTTRYVETTGQDVGNCQDPGAPCATLGYAQSQALEGDVVLLGSGSFAGTAISKRITLRGAGQTQTLLGPCSITAAGGSVTNRVVLSHLGFEGTGTGRALQLNASFVSLLNVSVNNFNYGIDIASATPTTLTDLLFDGLVTNNNFYAVFVNSRVTINGFTIQNHYAELNEFAVYFSAYGAGPLPIAKSYVNNLTVRNSFYLNTKDRSFYLEKLADSAPGTFALFDHLTIRQSNGQSCLYINLKWADYRNITVNHCRFQAGPGGRGFAILARNDNTIPISGPNYSVQPASVRDVRVTGCSFEGGQYATYWGGNITVVPVVEYSTFRNVQGVNAFNFTGSVVLQKPGVAVNMIRNWYDNQAPTVAYYGFVRLTSPTQAVLLGGLTTAAVNLNDNIYFIDTNAISQSVPDTLIARSTVLAKDDTTLILSSAVSGGQPPVAGAVVGDTIAVAFTPASVVVNNASQFPDFLTALSNGVLVSNTLPNPIMRLSSNGSFLGSHATVQDALNASTDGNRIFNLPVGLIPGVTRASQNVALVTNGCGSLDPLSRSTFVIFDNLNGETAFVGDVAVQEELRIAQAINIANHDLYLSGIGSGPGLIRTNAQSGLFLSGGEQDFGTLRFQNTSQPIRKLVLNRGTCSVTRFANNLTVSQWLELASGRLRMGSGLGLSYQAERLQGTNSQGYVDGVLGLTAYGSATVNLTFPVGDETGFRPFSIIKASQFQTTFYTASALAISPSVASASVQAPLSAVSRGGHWLVTASTPLTAVVGVKAAVTALDDASILPLVRLAQVGGTGWVSVGGTVAGQSITSSLLVNSILGRFALAAEGTSSNFSSDLVHIQDFQGNPYCAGDTFSVFFRSVGGYAPGTVFTALLSDANGSFAAAQSIGSTTVVGAGSGTILATLPQGLPYGQGYRVRVAAGTGAETVLSYCVPITVAPLPSAPTITVSGSTVLCPGTSSAVLSVPPVAGVVYDWRYNGASVGTNEPTLAASEAGQYVVRLVSACGEIQSSNTITLETVNLADSSSFSLITTGSTLLCSAGASVQLAVGPVPPVGTLNWIRNGQPTGLNTPVITVNQPGSYRLQVITPCGQFFVKGSVLVESGQAVEGFTISANGPLDICSTGGSLLLSGPSVPNATYAWSRNGQAVGQNSPTILVSLGGVYQLTITTVCGVFPGGNSLTVNVVSPPVKPVITQVGNTLVSSAAENNQWIGPDGQPIPGATGQAFTPLASGGYRVRVRVSDGCESISDVYLFFGTSVADGVSGVAIRAYPNPTPGLLHLAGVPAGATISVRDALGRNVLTHIPNPTDDTYTLDLTALPTGVYGLEVQTPQGRWATTIVRQGE